MTEEPQFIYGVFKQEIKNRFLCSVEIGGETVTCYVPSSCRLSNFLDMTDRSVILTPITNPKAKTRLALYAVKYGRSYVSINLANSNRTVEQQIYRRYFAFLGKRKNVTRETKIGDYKCDLFINDTNTIVEIKSLLAFEKQAVFPTVYSERAVKQLEQLSALLDQGYPVCFMMISLSTTVKEISINREIEDFYRLFVECVNKGMQYRGFSLRLNNGEMEVSSMIKMNI